MRALILGFDSFDPKLFETFSGQGDVTKPDQTCRRQRLFSL